MRRKNKKNLVAQYAEINVIFLIINEKINSTIIDKELINNK